MSMRNLSMSITAFNRTARAFGQVNTDLSKLKTEAKQTTQQIKNYSNAVVGLGAGMFVVSQLGEAFGLLNDEQSRTVSQIGGVVMAVGALIRLYDILKTSSIAVAIAENARATAHALAWAFSGPAGWAILASSATAAGIAFAYLATQTRSATEAQIGFNAVTTETVGKMKSIERAGDPYTTRRTLTRPRAKTASELKDEQRRRGIEDE